MTITPKLSDLLAVVLLAVAYANPQIELGGGTVTPVGPTIAAPSAELQALVTPIAALVVGDKAASDRAELSAFCLALAEFHARDKSVIIKTTNLLQRHTDLALQGLYQGTGMAARNAGTAAAINLALGNRLGVAGSGASYKAGPFDAVASAKTAEFYAALAWAYAQPITPAKG
jgi:hypothetical protein